MARQDALLRLHKNLLARRAELRKRLGLELQQMGAGKDSSPTGDVADAAFDASGEEIASTLAELESRELAQIERALRRLKAGTYGKCEVCSTKIPVARLNALPYSTLCVKCQREAEQEGGWNGSYGEQDWGRLVDDASADDPEINFSDLERSV